jgi:hypothetical protein
LILNGQENHLSNVMGDPYSPLVTIDGYSRVFLWGCVARGLFEKTKTNRAADLQDWAGQLEGNWRELNWRLNSTISRFEGG